MITEQNECRERAMLGESRAGARRGFTKFYIAEKLRLLDAGIALIGEPDTTQNQAKKRIVKRKRESLEKAANQMLSM
jgi:hypothetical protein